MHVYTLGLDVNLSTAWLPNSERESSTCCKQEPQPSLLSPTARRELCGQLELCPFLIMTGRLGAGGRTSVHGDYIYTCEVERGNAHTW